MFSLVKKGIATLLTVALLYLAFTLLPKTPDELQVTPKLGAAITASNYSNCKTITVANAQVTADVSGFPMLIDLTDSDLASQSDSNGGDIVFTDSTGEILNFEIEKFVKGTGTLQAWASTTLANLTDTTIRMYYGTTSNVGSLANATGVWDSNYKGVWHLKETSGNHNDSTSNANNSTAISAAAQGTAAGKIDGADTMTGASNVITVADHPSVDLGSAFTLSAWVNSTSWGAGYRAIVRHGSASGQAALYSKAGKLHYYEGGGDIGTANTTLSNDTWYYVTLTSTGSNLITFYVNGTADGTIIYTPSFNSTESLYLGGDPFNQPMNGTFDEPRISNTVRSANWISTEYNNQSSTSTFYTVSAEFGTTCAAAGGGGAAKVAPVIWFFED